jgi:hypothetical protein
MDLAVRHPKMDRLFLSDASTDHRKVVRDLLRLAQFPLLVGCRVVTTVDRDVSVDGRPVMLTKRIRIRIEDAGLRNVRTVIEIGTL